MSKLIGTEDLFHQLKRHEGLRLKPYRDTTGHLSIGYGLNLDEGITEDEASSLLFVRLGKVIWETAEAFPIILTMAYPRKAVIDNMSYNLGVPRLKKFVKMWAALEAKDFNAAADEMLDSRWAWQVGKRAHELAQQMRLGRFLTVEEVANL